MDYLPSGLSMWERACELIDEAERRHRRFFELLAVGSQQPAWEPPVDIFLLERELQVVVALPGVRAEDIELEVSADALLLRAMHELPQLANPARIVRLEIPYGRIERRIELPPGRYQLLEHGLADGCLRVRLAGAWP